MNTFLYENEKLIDLFHFECLKFISLDSMA